MHRKRSCWTRALTAVVCLAFLAAGSAAAAEKPKPAARDAPGLLDIPQVPRDQVICFALYTVHNNILKLTAQLYPLQEGEPRTVRLEVQRDGPWQEVARTEVLTPGWTAPFRIENWDMAKDVPYRVRHGKSAVYEGFVRHNPVEKEEIVVAAFTGNSIYPGHGGDIPRTDIVENIKRLKPDLLFFSGDQVYDHNRHYAYWLKFGRDFGEAIRQFPTVTIPDDHDVGHPNLWGAGGKQSLVPQGHDGGYYKPVAYVQEVERAQTSHLPDPYDPAPVARGIGVYYTALNVGGISFAIIEDRKFKSGPEGLVKHGGPRPDHVKDPTIDPKTLDVPGAELLGQRQLKFLREWAADWRSAQMKAVLSQTLFCGGAHLHGTLNNRILADLDSNGWPQTGRNQALAEMRKAFALHIAGDQHLGTVICHGIDDWNDAGWSFCVPSIANLYLRWWAPLEPGKNRRPGMPNYTGEFLDGLGNKIAVWAVANPNLEENHDKLTTRAAGYGVIRFNKTKRTITMECWPRNVDITAPGAKPYDGWPITIHQSDNYGRKAVAYLPTLKVRGTEDPVVQVVEEASGEIVYTVRIKGTEFRPKVFATGAYTLRVGQQPGRMKELKGVQALAPDQAAEVVVEVLGLPKLP
ncbi:MAG: alkaline phosphatase D family protein [Planctomycetes bacterium]|nr:alkaline phosphatase D family protein [Planctomycetota bacterium]